MAILLERFEFPASPSPIGEAELCRLDYREKEPAHPKMPHTARQNLACHATDVKKPLLRRLSASSSGVQSRPRFLRDRHTVPEAVLFVKRFFVALHIHRFYTQNQAACR